MTLKTGQPVIDTRDGNISIRTSDTGALTFEDSLAGERTLSSLAAGGGGGGLSWSTVSNDSDFTANLSSGYRIELFYVTTFKTVNVPTSPSNGDIFAVSAVPASSSPSNRDRYVLISGSLGEDTPDRVYAGETVYYCYQGGFLGWCAIDREVLDSIKWTRTATVSGTLETYQNVGYIIGNVSAPTGAITVELNAAYGNGKPIGIGCVNDGGQTITIQYSGGSTIIDGQVGGTIRLKSGEYYMFSPCDNLATGFNTIMKYTINEGLNTVQLLDPTSVDLVPGNEYILKFSTPAANGTPVYLNCNLPASPYDKDRVSVRFYADDNSLNRIYQIFANGNDIEGDTTNYIFGSYTDHIEMVYSATNTQWFRAKNNIRKEIIWDNILVDQAGATYTLYPGNGIIVFQNQTADFNIQVNSDDNGAPCAVYCEDANDLAITVTNSRGLGYIDGVPSATITLKTGDYIEFIPSKANNGGVLTNSNRADLSPIPNITTDETNLKTIQDYINEVTGTGWISGGEVTLNGTNPTTQIDVSAGVAFLKDGSTSLGSKASFVPFPAAAGLTISINIPHFVYAQYSSGSIVTNVTTNPAIIADETATVINSVFNDGTEIYITNFAEGWRSLTLKLFNRHSTIAEGRGNLFAEWGKGSLIGVTGTRNLTVTEGTWFSSLNEKVLPARDTSAADTMFAFYDDGAGGHTKLTGQTQLDNTQYDTGAGLASLTNNNYTNRYIYYDFAGENFGYVFGRAQYNTLTDAAAEERPSDVPVYISQYSVYLGKVVVQEGSDDTNVYTAFLNGTSAAPVQSHAQLSNVNADPKIQHINVAEQEWITGCVDGEQLTSAYDPASRTVLITGADLKLLYNNAVVPGFSGNSFVSAANPNAAPTQIQFYYYNGAAFVWSDGVPWEFEKAPLSAQLYNSDGEFLWGLRETHTNRRNPTHHRNEHDNIGTYRQSGGDITGFVFNSTTLADKQPDISACVLWDEDLKTTNSAVSTPAYCQMKLLNGTEGRGVPKISRNQTEIIETSGGIPLYNFWNGSAWVTATLPSNDFLSVFVLAVPADNNPNSSAARFQFWMGQNPTNTLSAQRSVTTADMSIGEILDSETEYVFIEQIIIQRSGSNYQVIETNRLDGSRAQQVISGGGLTSVSTDQTTIDGNGTASDPLSIILPTIVTTSDDGTTSLTSVSRRFQLASGSGINHIFNLPDATTLTNGDFFEIINSSSEFVGAENTDKSVFMRLPPTCSAKFTLTNNGTAAGTWNYTRTHIVNGAIGYEDQEDWLGRTPGVYGGKLGFLDVVSGAGASVNNSSTLPNQFGSIFIGTGTTSTGSAVFFTGGSEKAGESAIGLDWFINFNALSNATEEYKVNLGFNNSGSGAAVTGGFGVRYDRATYTSGNWAYYTHDTSTESITESSVAVTTVNNYIRIEAASDGSRIDYWANKTHLGSKTTNIPASVYGFLQHSIVKSAGTSDRQLIIDYLALQMALTSRRW